MESAILNVFDLSSSPTRRAEVLNLIERNFPQGSPTSRALSVDEEFFELLDPSNSSRVLFLCDETGAVVSALAWKSFTVQSLGFAHPISVAAIGLVVTEKENRGQGLSSALLEAAETRARESGTTLCYLWSDLEFYLKRDYLPLGSELSWVMDDRDQELLLRRLNSEASLDATSQSRLEAAKSSRCLELFEDLKIGPTRQSALYDRFLSLPESEGLFFKVAKSQSDGYALFGKARDLRNTLHEIVGPREIVAPALLHLLNHADKSATKSLRVQYPVGGPLEDELKYWLGMIHGEAFALVKLLNPQSFIEILKRAGVPRGLKIEVLEEGFQICGPDGHEEFYSPDFSHLTQIFMSPFHPREFGTLSPRILDALANFQSLNPYFWGMDSV